MQQVWAVDPMRPTSPLPIPERLQRQSQAELRQASVKTVDKRNPQTAAREDDGYRGPLVRTALTVEAREGCLRAFLPPLSSADDYVDLTAAIEDTAAKLGLPISVEGYPPPPDWRLQQIKVTPDPGVIEVNVQSHGQLA